MSQIFLLISHIYFQNKIKKLSSNKFLNVQKCLEIGLIILFVICFIFIVEEILDFKNYCIEDGPPCKYLFFFFFCSPSSLSFKINQVMVIPGRSDIHYFISLSPTFFTLSAIEVRVHQYAVTRKMQRWPLMAIFSFSPFFFAAP